MAEETVPSPTQLFCQNSMVTKIVEVEVEVEVPSPVKPAPEVMVDQVF
jgi:hypothetical protein